jgi:hypothetical protein
VGLGIDVRVDADGDGRLAAQLAGHVVDAGELRLALHVEAKHAGLQRQLDLGFGLADAGEDAAVSVAACRHDALEFAPADEIERGAQVRKEAQHREVGVGLHRVANLKVEPGQAGAQAAVVVLDGLGAVDIRRRAMELGDGREVDGLAVQFLAGVMEVVHRGKVSVKGVQIASFPLRGSAIFQWMTVR